MRELSPLHKERLGYNPKLAGELSKGIKNLSVNYLEKTSAVKDVEQIQELFPRIFAQPIVQFGSTGEKIELEKKNVGVILSGGQAPGGHYPF